MPTSMQAAVYHRHGGPEVLRVEEVVKPVPGPTEVLVRVHAAGVDPVDWKTRSGGGVTGIAGDLPLIPGWDVSGVVEEVGIGVTTLEPGDEVYGMPRFPRAAGCYAEYLTAPSRQLARKPATVTHAEAAAVPLAALTASHALVDTARLAPGQRLLIHAAEGGVGHFAIQIAKHLGAHVFGTASAARHSWLTGLGADAVVDYTSLDFEDAFDDLDVVLNPIGDDYRTSFRSLETLQPGGLHITLNGSHPELAVAADERRVRTQALLVEPDGATLKQIADLIDTGSVSIEVDQSFSLADVAKAHEHGEGGHTRGKVVLRVID
ncbi:NADP-dependent oxidoreductase [Amycolatopsis sp. lyj-23]|uniref:NADP-dependent oxidoreductase n=1 Tax=Amycolatopsis sp. lyj-23 TaxID=2789283 RepID=UPI003978071D